MNNPEAEKIITSRDIVELEHLRRQNAEMRSALLQSLVCGALKLRDMPLDLQDNEEFVMAAVRGRTVDWSELPSKWKDKVEIVCAYFEWDKRKFFERSRLSTVSSSTDDGPKALKWSQLPYELRINEEVISHALRADGSGLEWDGVHVQLQSKEGLLVTALKYGKVRFDKIPEDLQMNHQEIAFYGIQNNYIQADDCTCLNQDFYKKVLEDDELDWVQLPSNLKTDMGFARSISRFSDQKLVVQILANVLEIRRDLPFWYKLIQTDELKLECNAWDRKALNLKYLLETYAPVELFSNEHFMLNVCRVCANAFVLVDRSLANNIDFLETALDENVKLLQFIPHETQQLHRDLILNNIPRLRQLEEEKEHRMVPYYTAQNIWPDFWLDYDFAITWITSGLGWPQGANILAAWWEDPQLCLAYAVHSESLSRVSPDFTGDVNFMLQVLHHHPSLYQGATGAAKTDPWVKTAAFGGCPQVAKDRVTELHFEGRDQEIADYLDFLRSQLDPFRTFSKFVLGNMLSTQSVEDTGTPLTLLNQGLETSITYKQTFADYLGVHRGYWLRRLQSAEKNVLDAIAPWSCHAE